MNNLKSRTIPFSQAGNKHHKNANAKARRTAECGEQSPGCLRCQQSRILRCHKEFLADSRNPAFCVSKARHPPG